ncbi:flagellar biosynthetic protein FliR [Algihabitans albus]|uniref:flagellar biosynthetic protein FliR n=1 Tax=Algihabitans albus TaxID=2164067 RepID=UPI000E5CFE32|nr:flagellar biosynthetic protein FliR [Algihabitans albus]
MLETPLFEALLPAHVFGLLLVFVRIGAALMVLPGIGEPFISARSRLMLALMISLIAFPIASPSLPALPTSIPPMFLLILGELVVGLFLGTVARLLMSALVIGGMIIAFSTSMANALVMDPSSAQQGSITGSFLNLIALLLIFALDLHHLLFTAIIDSYMLFPPGEPLPIGDLSDVIARVLAHAFLLACQIAAPFIVVAGIFNLGLGLLARLMPQMQIFFVAMPLQIAMGLVVMAFALPVMMGVFITGFESTVTDLLLP